MKIQGLVRKTNRLGGFTLMELLVVISIIAVLASLMIPIAGMMAVRARNAQAEQTAANLKNAITAYFTDYRRYPVRSTVREGDSQVLSDHSLMDALLGADSEAKPGGLNTRRTLYYSGNQARPATNGRYRAGVKLSDGGAGELWDPFSEYYRVTLDTDNNNRIFAPDWFRAESKELPGSIIVWSAGRDKDDSTKEDNIKTW